jgi:ADP-heptose:LPS heptosyltransferase
MAQRSVETKPEKVLIIRLGAFGDILQSDGAMRDIRNRHPTASITVLTTSPFRKIFQRCPGIDRILIDPRAPRVRLDKFFGVILMLRREGFDFIYDLQNSRRTLSYRKWIKAHWSQKDEAFFRLLQKKTGQLSTLERNRIQLVQAGVDATHALRPDIHWLAEDMDGLLADAELKPGFVFLIPGCSARHLNRRWPYFCELATALKAEGLSVATAPGPDEIDLCRTLPATLLLKDGKPLNYFQLAGIVQRAGFAIGNDTGPTHMAAYLGVKGLALFGRFSQAHGTGLEAFFRIFDVHDLRDLSWQEVLSATRAGLGLK